MKVLIAVLLLFTNNTSALLQSKQYRFSAQFANPLGGQQIMLTPNYYDLTIKDDSLICFLPYYGRAYSAPADPQEAGFKLTTTQFSYSSQAVKHGWEIQIQPKGNDIQRITLFVGSGGHATVTVISNSKQAITFDGEITARVQP